MARTYLQEERKQMTQLINSAQETIDALEKLVSGNEGKQTIMCDAYLLESALKFATIAQSQMCSYRDLIDARRAEAGVAKPRRSNKDGK